MDNKNENEIYIGPRDKEFETLIRNILKTGKLQTKYINILMTPANMTLFGQAFTASSADPVQNFEVFEQLGDLSANKFIVSYMYDRFPQLNCSEAVKIVARLRINYGAKQSFFKIAQNLGFWPYISASVEQRSRQMRPLLEDVFEAFIGVTEYIIDKKT